ncbi:flagellum-associated coiled-coil domain-containing protein 1 isoform X2 [Ornithorhynchus anatinus]|uniref:flagellum-associated coiled-coil domain-containing protein 1 isoform X2 n=1 Tax=Ornithorhynchus anatinus TaxID=9258 RepID=UPI0019D46630|nr:flagellum-associated coiled-coil domain-containing protein 1 isoform X2 [Ornithorhynchus anatinus]
MASGASAAKIGEGSAAMSRSSLLYTPCWQPWEVGSRKLLKTTQALHKTPGQKPRKKDPSKTHGSKPRSKEPIHEQKEISPGYTFFRTAEQISVTLGEEMFVGTKKREEAEATPSPTPFAIPALSAWIPRANLVPDLQQQVSELTVMIEQMNRDHQSAQKQIRDEMELRCRDMERDYEENLRELSEVHSTELRSLEEKHQSMLRDEKMSAQERLEKMMKEYKYLKNMFRMYQDSIAEEMEEKWMRRKAEWERSEKMEREQALLQQKLKLMKKFKMDVEEEKKKIQVASQQTCDTYLQEKENLKQQLQEEHAKLEEMQRAKEVAEEEILEQASALESLNATLYQTQLELQKEKNTLTNMEKTLSRALTEMEEKYRIQLKYLLEENTILKRKILTKSEDQIREKIQRRTSTVPPGILASRSEYRKST